MVTQTVPRPRVFSGVESTLQKLCLRRDTRRTSGCHKLHNSKCTNAFSGHLSCFDTNGSRATKGSGTQQIRTACGEADLGCSLASKNVSLQ